MAVMNIYIFIVGFSICGRAFGAPQEGKIEKEVELIIVGAGASGVAASTRLLENNFTNFLVLEGANRIGGRLHSVPFGGGTIELGGEWVHGKTDNPVFQMGSSLGLLYTSENYYSVFDHHYTSDHSKINPDLVAIGVDLIVNTIFSSSDNTSMKSFGEEFERKYWDSVQPLIAVGNITRKEAEEYIIWVEKTSNSMNASPSWKVTSRVDDYQYVDEVDDFAIIWKGGFSYATLFDILKKKIPNPAEELPLNDKILFNKDVISINWSGLDVIVSCADGTKYKAKKVITTVSLGVLKERAATMFQPSLPAQKLKAIQALGFGTCNKIFLEYPYRWWPSGVIGLNLIWKTKDKATFSPENAWATSIYGFYQTDRLPLNLLSGWICGLEAQAMESHSDEEVLTVVTSVLRKFLEPTVKVPSPIAIRRSQWHTNPLTRGSWSFRHIDSDSKNVTRKDLEEPVTNQAGKRVLLFAGEASHDIHSSTVHGAVKAGWREAERVLEDLNQDH